MRRWASFAAVGALLVAASSRELAPASGSAGAAAANPVQIENSRAGTSGWELAVTQQIQGYSSETSVAAGDTLHLHANVWPPASYRVEVYRLGWYGGVGARLVACSPSCFGERPGVTQTGEQPDPVTGELALRWPVTDAIAVGAGWTSGYYLANLVLTTGADQGRGEQVPFVVRPPSGAPASRILVQAAVNSWQAYNEWGGKSLYAYNSSSGVAATQVSYDRPYAQEGGNVTPLTWEYPLVRFLERNGYDVSYTTDVDTDADPRELTRHVLVIAAGHDEYWSKAVRDGFETARAAGIDLMFLGADIGDWQIRYKDGRRTIVEYRTAVGDPSPDAATKTTLFRQLVPPRPPCALGGVQYQGGLRSSHASPTDYEVVEASFGDPWFLGTGFQPGSMLPGLVGYEWDGVQNGCATPPLTVLFHATGPPDADAVRYTAPSGSKVFSSGSLQFLWGLDGYGGHGALVDPRLERFMRNALADMTRAPAPTGDPPMNTSPPQVLGEPRVGRAVLTAPGLWVAPAAPTLRYQWQRCDAAAHLCSTIVGAAQSAYMPAPVDVGHTLRVNVTATISSGSLSVTSPPSVVVSPARVVRRR